MMKVTRIPNTQVAIRRGDGTHLTTVECAALVIHGKGPPLDIEKSMFDLLEFHDGSYEVECTHEEAVDDQWWGRWAAFDRGEGVTG